MAAGIGSLDICRLLLASGASGSHTDAQGWTATFYLWSSVDVQMLERTAFLNLLIMNGDCDLNAVGCFNWTALHRAAAFGTPTDVSFLVQKGAKTSIFTEGLRWSPLHYAAFFGNDPVLCEMTKPQYGVNIDQPDIRGWSPLHIGVYGENWTTVATLLRLGASPNARITPTTFHVPAKLKSCSFTPEDIAKTMGPIAWRAYIAAVEQNEAVVDRNGTSDVFWDAVEEF